jgi:branched-subunit amino acid aminotransferase/4-amino-4-deoxychorismate lyase
VAAEVWELPRVDHNFYVFSEKRVSASACALSAERHLAEGQSSIIHFHAHGQVCHGEIHNIFLPEEDKTA